MSRQGGIQADTPKDDPAWIHSGEPGTTGREPFEDTAGANAPGAQHHERQHHGFSDGNQGLTGHHHQGGLQSGAEAGLGSSGSGLGGLTTGSGQHHHHQHQHGVSDETLGRAGVTGGQSQTQGNFKDFDNKPSFGENVPRPDNHDRVGNLNESGAMYERTGAGGPVTGGAAGTDRFDSDRHHGNHEHERAMGDRAYEQAATGANSSSNTNSRAGGMLSGLTTTDNEFTGKDRSHTGPNVPTSAGAYEDTSADFKSNTSGPGGNTALTGREGTTSKNPVANATSTGAGVGEPTGRVGQAEHGAEHAAAAEHKGIFQKIKEIL